MGYGKSRLEERMVTVLLEGAAKLRFFGDGRMQISAIGQLNMEGKSIFFVFQSRKERNRKARNLYAAKVAKATPWI